MSFQILLVTIAIAAMAMADKPHRPKERVNPPDVVTKADGGKQKKVVVKKRPVERNLKSQRPIASARVAKKVKAPAAPVRQARLIKPQVALKRPLPVQRRKKVVAKAQHRQQVPNGRPQRVSNFARFLKQFSKQVNRPSLRVR